MAKLKIVTPIVEVVYAFVERPSPNYGNYSITVALEPDKNSEHKAFVAQMDELAAAARARILAGVTGNEQKKLSKYTLYNKLTPEKDDAGDLTGRLLFTAKSGTSYTDRKTGKVVPITIPLFNAKKEAVRHKTNFSTGSKVRVRFNPADMTMDKDEIIGITAYLDAVQIIHLEQYAGSGASGFDEEEGYDGLGEEGGWTGGEEVEAPAGDPGGGDY